MTPKEILDLPLTDNLEGQGLGEQTIRGYLINLLYTLWDDGEEFSGKRPLGDSGWQYDLIITLVRNRAIAGSVDDDGYTFNVNESAADIMIRDAIKHLGDNNGN